ncbi:2Fe-2S iron-sulfur cluster-binding protein [Sphingopyxis terrae]|uniref:2Fe-2S iron-sulfur cluster-binding protein n=1 Tax=Sphingopyxis terrae TaxID=33052 RepID=UPI002A1796A1|nr:2Fe-2S iron-sulfur cluster-binding protein [Sphingopyxis terrae]MDX8356410.1 2Fe-2S iron-sulfur cluster-binding protein [Sphingopyxis terrae]
MDVLLTEPDGRRLVLRAKPGETLMRVATRNAVNGIDAECGGSCACATCHIIVDDDWFVKVGEPGEVEDALLDMVPDRRSTSRLSCQLRLDPSLDGLIVRVPERR